MRVLIIAAGAAALVGLAGCSKPSAAAVREQIYNSCKADDTGAFAQVPNREQFCGCLADKTVEGRTPDQLDNWNRNEQAAGEAGQQAAMQCVSTIVGGEAETK